jgi:uncharacterized damage-inducible protein DinB
MQTDQITKLFDYHWSITERLLDMAGQLPDEIYYAELNHGPGSIHKLHFHLITALNSWRIALETGSQQPGLDIKEYPDRDAIQNLLIQERRAWDDYLSQLIEGDLNDHVTLNNLRGNEYTLPLWHVLVHLILHGMQHHSELAHALTSHGHSPGNIDFIFYST